MKNKIVVISGGNSGIGKATVQLLSRNRNVTVFSLARHVINYTRNNIHQLKCDVANEKSVKNSVYKIVSKYNRVDALVNNAGIDADNFFVMMSRHEWDRVINTNLGGCFNLTRSILPYMIANHGGKICNVASISGVFGNSGQANYSASKAGIIALTKTLSKEYAKYNINVNCVSPGFIKTAMTLKLNQHKIKDRIPLQRLGKPIDVAYVIQFLVSHKSNYITGQNIIIDGGFSND